MGIPLFFCHFHAGPGCVAQSVARLTQEPEVPGLVPGRATYFCLIEEGQLSVTGPSMCIKYRLTA